MSYYVSCIIQINVYEFELHNKATAKTTLIIRDAKKDMFVQPLSTYLHTKYVCVR